MPQILSPVKAQSYRASAAALTATLVGRPASNGSASEQTNELNQEHNIVLTWARPRLRS